MPWPFLVWLLSFVFQAAVLGCSMYQLVQLTDLETDHINPHEAAKNFNSVVMPAFIAQIMVTAVALVGRNWMYGLVQLGVLLFEGYRFVQREQYVDVTEIFRMMPKRRTVLARKLVVLLLFFAWSLYRFVEIMVLSLVSSSGRKAARSVLREAAAALH